MHSIYDFDTHFKIDPITRKITNESSSKSTLMQYDHNSERFTFEVPKTIEGHDIMDCTKVEIHYINLDGGNVNNKTSGVYEVEDLQISPDDEDVAIFSWVISSNATNYAGKLNFIVRFVCIEDGKLTYAWHSDIYNKITITSGMNNGNEVVQQYADVLQQWKDEISNIATGKDGYTPQKGIDYFDGKDGVSPTITVNKAGTTATVTITDANGSKSFTVEDGTKGANGVDGKTPIRGVDYWTDEDVAEMKSYIDVQLGVIENGTY